VTLQFRKFFFPSPTDNRLEISSSKAICIDRYLSNWCCSGASWLTEGCHLLFSWYRSSSGLFLSPPPGRSPWGSNPGSCACSTSALALSYIPSPAPSFFQDSFAGCRSFGWQSFPFILLTVSSRYPLTSVVSDVKPVHLVEKGVDHFEFILLGIHWVSGCIN
jgi:hypothetical protein